MQILLFVSTIFVAQVKTKEIKEKRIKKKYLFLKAMKMKVVKVESNANLNFCNLTTNVTNIEDGFLLNFYGTVFEDVDKITVNTLN